MSPARGPSPAAAARQQPLAGCGQPRERRLDRLFFAVYPDAAAQQQVQALAQRLRAEHGLKGRPIPPERSHVTLAFVGSFQGLPGGLVDRLRQAGAAVEAAPLAVSFDQVGSFDNRPHNRPLVLRGQDGTRAVAGLHQVLREALVAAGLPDDGPGPYTPHLTLLYDDCKLPLQPVPPIGWTVRELVLVHSLVGLSTHVPLARWRLGRPGTGD
ncbi:MAG TPA: RNA 2',3'-cyclic phosphodiesterase [Aquabacterium sp.]|nr:RNA 2',3'-cyclic phosphodiesterase [Aquabacterium sp.]